MIIRPVIRDIISPVVSRVTDTRVRRGATTVDADASVYIAAVEAADTQSLEPAIRVAINDFVVGCKADGIWDAIKASCILAGARTLVGALVPLKGPAPTNVGPFVSGDYSRTAGLESTTTKSLDTNFAGNAIPNADVSLGLWITKLPPVATSNGLIGSGGGGTGATSIAQIAVGTRRAWSRSRNGDPNAVENAVALGLFGSARSNTSNYSFRGNGTTTTLTQGVQASPSENVLVFSRGSVESVPGAFGAGFYWIGESLNLETLDTRLSALMSAIGAALS